MEAEVGPGARWRSGGAGSPVGSVAPEWQELTGHSAWFLGAGDFEAGRFIDRAHLESEVVGVMDGSMGIAVCVPEEAPQGVGLKLAEMQLGGMDVEASGLADSVTNFDGIPLEGKVLAGGGGVGGHGVLV